MVIVVRMMASTFSTGNWVSSGPNVGLFLFVFSHGILDGAVGFGRNRSDRQASNRIESIDIHLPYRTLWALYLVDITLHYFEHLSLLGPMARNNVSELAHAFAGACQRLTPVD
jgi:hypothetical protein